MSTFGVSKLSFKDIFDDDPEDHVFAAQEKNWYAISNIGKVVLRYDEAYQLLKDKRFRNIGTSTLDDQGIEDGLIYDAFNQFLLAKEGTDHANLRNLIRKPFSASNIEALRPKIRARLHYILDNLQHKTHFDFIEEVAEKFPAQIIADFLGLDVFMDDKEFWKLCADYSFIVGFELEKRKPEIENAILRIGEKITPVIESRKRNPKEDLISVLLTDEKLTLEDLIFIIINLVFGGLDTTRRTIGKAFELLLKNPGQLKILRNNPELATLATEEIFRHRPGTRVAIRIANEDLLLNDVPIKKDERIIIATGIANLDPSKYPNSNTFNITRKGPKSLAFGAGIHHCLGVHLARTELQEALPIIATRMQDISISGPIVYRTAEEGSPGPISIPIACDIIDQTELIPSL